MLKQLSDMWLSLAMKPKINLPIFVTLRHLMTSKIGVSMSGAFLVHFCFQWPTGGKKLTGHFVQQVFYILSQSQSEIEKTKTYIARMKQAFWLK